MTNPVASAKVARAIDRALRPILTANGFSKFKGRSAYRYEDDTIFGFTTGAVGAYFASITGFTPCSFTATLFVNYRAIPARNEQALDDDGLSVPTSMHRHIALPSNLENQDRTGISSIPERNRDDVWWVHPDGENLDLLTRDLATVFEAQGSDWIALHLDKERVLAMVDSEGDCFAKYEFMYCIARSAGSTTYARKYEDLYYRNMPKYVRDIMRKQGYDVPSL
jgi:hypothetical protein